MQVFQRDPTKSSGMKIRKHKRENIHIRLMHRDRIECRKSTETQPVCMPAKEQANFAKS